jgi:hypothetical protein
MKDMTRTAEFQRGYEKHTGCCTKRQVTVTLRSGEGDHIQQLDNRTIIPDVAKGASDPLTAVSDSGSNLGGNDQTVVRAQQEKTPLALTNSQNP